MKKSKIIETLENEIRRVAHMLETTGVGNTQDREENLKFRGRYNGLVFALSLHSVEVFATPYFDDGFFYALNLKFINKEAAPC